MVLHPKLQAMLAKAAQLPALSSLTPAQIRAGDLARYAKVPIVDVAHVEDRWIAGPRGDIRIRIYRPDSASGHPIVTFFHGSGFVICSIDTHDGLCRQLCKRAHAVVVSVDYRLAPEHKFPAGPDDALAATRWVHANAVEIGGDPGQLIVAGDSAGATMALVTAIRLRDADSANASAIVSGQILMYPVTNYPDPAPLSYVERGSGYGLSAADMHYFWGHYLNTPDEGTHPDASPLRTERLAGLPRTYIMTAEYDPLRDEGEQLAARLVAEGGNVVLSHYGDMNHGFMSWVGWLDRADEALDAACIWIADRS